MNYFLGKSRKEAFDKLKVFIANPGRFSLIVLGSRGTGKRFAIEKAFEELNLKEEQGLCLTSISFIEPINFPTSEDVLDELMKNNEDKTLIVEDVENLTLEQQRILFKAMSSTDGKFGIKEKYGVRIVFTSSKDIDALREDGNYLTGSFWDRISQLIVEFPSYKMEKESVVRDFRNTWEKMKFENIERYRHFADVPKNYTLEKFLEDNAEKFDGGFRDLDKLTCMYFNYRIYYYGEMEKIDEVTEKKVIQSVKNDFFSKSQMKGSSGNEASIFQIRPGFAMRDLLGQFKIQVRKWAKKEYGTIAKAEEALGLGN